MCMPIEVCTGPNCRALRVCVCMCVCVSAGGAVHVSHTRTDQRRHHFRAFVRPPHTTSAPPTPTPTVTKKQ